jgi:alanine racemase
MLNQFLAIFKKPYQVLNKIEVSKTALINNYRYLSSLSSKIRIAPVIKSNGYGHGITQVAEILKEEKVPFFCVDSLFEGYQLLKAKISTPILIMGYTNPDNLKIKKLPFRFAVYDLETAKTLNEYQKGSRVHIFVDTALHREGVQVEKLQEFLTAMKQFNNLTIEGLMSHFASTESDQDPLFKLQLNNFKKAEEIFKKMDITPKWIHIGASGGLINPSTRKEIVKISNLVRAGLICYGIGPDPKLKPVLTLKSTLAQIKQIKRGEKVGYSGTFAAKKDMTIGILPIGYQDGVDRRLSNIGFVYVNDAACQIVGKVSMNITAIDLSNVKEPKVGQEVVVYSNNREHKNSIANSAKLCKTITPDSTIAYDLLIHLNPTIKRIIV